MAPKSTNEPVRAWVGVRIPHACTDCRAPLTEHCSVCGGCLDPASPDTCEGDCT